MVVCRICGEEKDAKDFTTIPYFTKYKKHSVIWCHQCQKLWMDMKKEKERLKKFMNDEQKFSVSFE